MRSRLIRGLAFAAVAAGVAGTVASSGGAIIGGSLIEIGSSPSTVYVEYGVGGNSVYRCTGSIIDATHIVTAGHCLYDLDNGNTQAQPSQLVVYAGLSNFFTPTSTDVTQSAKVSSFRIHPGYVVDGSGVGVDDVAVLTLASSLDLSSPGVQAVSLPAAGTALPGGTSVTVAGFGRQDASSPASGPLASITATVDPQGVCGEYTQSHAIEYDNAVEACFASPASSVCYGDSGAGVLASGGVLVGILTAGSPGCPTGSPGILTVVSAPEILAFIQGNDMPPTAPRPLRTNVYTFKWPEPLTVGASLTCLSAGWSSPVKISYTYTFVDTTTKAVLQSGPRSTFVVPSKAAGTTIRCQIAASNNGGTTLLSTIATSKIKRAPPPKKKR